MLHYRYSIAMSKILYNTYNNLLSWDELEDSLEAVMKFSCPKCGDIVRLQLKENNEGNRYTSKDRELHEHIERLEKKYYVVARSIRTQCKNGHAIDAVFIFGETQPARYVLVQAASVKPNVTRTEKIIILVTFTVILFSVFGITARSYFWYADQRELEKIGTKYSAEIVSVDASAVPKTPLSYHVSYRYYFGDLSYDGQSQIDEETYVTLTKSKTIDILIDPSEITRTAIKGNETPRAAFRYSQFVIAVVSLCLITAILYTKKQKRIPRLPES